MEKLSKSQSPQPQQRNGYKYLTCASRQDIFTTVSLRTQDTLGPCRASVAVHAPCTDPRKWGSTATAVDIGCSGCSGWRHARRPTRVPCRQNAEINIDAITTCSVWCIAKRLQPTCRKTRNELDIDVSEATTILHSGFNHRKEKRD